MKNERESHGLSVGQVEVWRPKKGDVVKLVDEREGVDGEFVVTSVSARGFSYKCAGGTIVELAKKNGKLQDG